ncbi:VRR-NUC domain-containing protein [Algimonas porphyrae]|uniref:VRR-NUC domain-containing protein n=1 Tax=Algimonas porphyrae TaxID=1128113 RepID=UPI00352AEDCE
MSWRQNPEYLLTKTVAGAFALHLDRRGIPWTHFPAGENRKLHVGSKLKRMGLKPGWPDFQIMMPGGRVLFIELKAGTGSLSKLQKQVHAELIAMGAPVSVCASLEAVLIVLKAEGLMDLPIKAPVQWTGRAAA